MKKFDVVTGEGLTPAERKKLKTFPLKGMGAYSDIRNGMIFVNTNFWTDSHRIRNLDPSFDILPTISLAIHLKDTEENRQLAKQVTLGCGTWKKDWTLGEVLALKEKSAKFALYPNEGSQKELLMFLDPKAYVVELQPSFSPDAPMVITSQKGANPRKNGKNKDL